MKKTFLFYYLLFSITVFTQTNYSDSWEDFFSYNNVKDFIKVDNVIYALSDNAVFTYDVLSGEVHKISSVQGLSGESTASIHYNATFKRVVIGYENGLVEIVDEDETITISSDIVSFNQTGEKGISHISEFQNTLYFSTPFALVAYDIEKLEFGDTFFIGNGSRDVNIHQTIVFKNQIYAATEVGIFKADVTSRNLIDFKNWQQLFTGRNFTEMAVFNDALYVSENTTLFRLEDSNMTPVKNFTEKIIGLKSSNSHLSVALNSFAFVFDQNMSETVQFTTNANNNFTLNNAFFENNTVFLATKELGILAAIASQPSNYVEIHPDGPLSNEVFSIAANHHHLWVVYGGYNATFTPILQRKGFSHFNGQNWINTKYNPDFPLTDLNYITIDTNAENKVFISSFGATSNVNSSLSGGLLVVENDEISNFYNHLNSPLQDIEVNNPNTVTIRVSGTALDSEGNLWVTNIGVPNELKKLSPSGTWSSYNMSTVKTNPAFGLSEMVVDANNSVWYGSRNNGVFIFNENGNRKKSLITTPNSGNLPDPTVRTVAVDGNNNIWLGTRSGMIVYNNATGVFEESISNANPIIILDEGIPKKLAGDQTINSIEVDGADNKWIGTDNGGALYTSPNGQTTIANFSKQNSPLPSNRILKIKVDDATGKVYFATDKGIVAYNSKVAPFGEVLGDVYAYPNPVLKHHQTVTIDGRNGTHLPKGTNVKIIDVAGNLVYETNVIEGQELQGGKVVWDKKNLSGKNVVSGVYIVLLSNEDASETSITKIAIVN